MAIRATLWTDWACAGGAPVGALTVVAGTYGEVLTGDDRCELTVVEDARVAVQLRQVLRVEDHAGVVREYRVTGRSRLLGAGVRTITAVGPLADGATAGLVRETSGGVTRYDVGGRLTPAEVVALTLTHAAADGVAWISAGTIDSTDPVTLTAPATGWTRLAWWRALADATGLELRLRRDGEAGYKLDLVERVGASAAVVPVAAGKQLLALTDADDDGALATAVTVLGDQLDGEPQGIGDQAWRLGTPSGSGPYWVPLTAPEGGAGPIAFDGQCVGCYLLRDSDGGTTAIADSRASDSAVQVASLTGLTAGALVQIVADTDGTWLTEVVRPGVARLHRVDQTAGGGPRNRLDAAGTWVGWSDEAIAPPGWTLINGSAARGAYYPRGQPATYSVTSQTSGTSTTLHLSNGPPGLRVLPLDLIGTHDHVVVGTVLDGSGAGSVTIEAAVDRAPATRSMSGIWIPRPAAIPEDDTGGPVWQLPRPTSGTYTNWPLTSASVGYRSSPIAVKRLAARPYLTLAAGMTVVTAVELGNRNWNGTELIEDVEVAMQRLLPSLAIRSASDGAILASVLRLQRIAAGATVHEVMACEYLLPNDVTVTAFLPLSPMSRADGPYTYARQFVRWVTLYLAPQSGGTIPRPAPLVPAATLWQRGNRALAARALTTRQIRCSWRDLSAAAGYALAREQLTLGGTVRLDDLAVTVRIAGLTWRADDPGAVEVVLDATPQRLAAFLAERVT